MKKFEEYVMDDLKVSEINLYRDANDTGRIFANKAVFERFHLNVPRFVIELDNGEKIYELRTSDAIDILNGANNNYSPYIINYRYIELNEDVSEYQSNREQEKRKKTFIFYRNINDPEKLYVRKEVFDRFHLDANSQPVIINGVPCYEIGEEDVAYISANATNNYAPYSVEERGIPLDRKDTLKNDLNELPYRERFIIYRNVDHPQTLYVRKDVFKRFHLNTDVEEVIISGIPCYVIDRGDLNYIIGNANNSYSPYDIEYRDVKVNSTNIKPAFNPDAKDVFKIFRNINNQEKWYADKKTFDRFHLNTEVEEVIISGVHCYALDENDLAYIMGNANNKYAPYKVEFVDIAIDSRNMKPVSNPNVKDKIVLYRNITDRELFFVRQDVFKRFHLETDVEEIKINGELYYVIDPDDLEYIVRNAGNKYAPYDIEFRDIPIGKLRRKKKLEESAKDLVDSGYIPRGTALRPRKRFINESNEDYVKYLEEFYEQLFGKGKEFVR